MNRIHRVIESPRRRRNVSAFVVTAAMLGLIHAPMVQGQKTVIPEMDPKATAATQEEVGMLKAPPADARRVYVGDQRAFETMTTVSAIDGNNGRYLGTIDAGMLPNPIVSPSGDKLYVVDTHLERYARGKRNDFITVYDAQTLDEVKEIDIPEGRSEMMTMDSLANLSPDGKYLVYYKFIPSSSFGIVDLEAGKYLNTIDTPQCYYVFPAKDRRVVMHCRDASLLDVKFDAEGKLADKKQTPPFHHPTEEPTLNLPAFDRQSGKIFFISYWGKVYPVDIADGVKVGKSWDLFTDRERKAGWLPGGWQTASYHRPSGRLYVLVDVRAKWTHETESTHVWIYDTKTAKKVKEIPLAHEVSSIAVDQSKNPHLYALSGHHKSLTIYNAETGAMVAHVEQLGREPKSVSLSSQ